MNVKQLIAALSSCPRSAEILFVAPGVRLTRSLPGSTRASTEAELVPIVMPIREAWTGPELQIDDQRFVVLVSDPTTPE